MTAAFASSRYEETRAERLESLRRRMAEMSGRMSGAASGATPPTCWARNLCWPCRGGWPNRCGCPGVGGGALGRPVAAVEHGGRGDGGRGQRRDRRPAGHRAAGRRRDGADLSRLAVIPDPGTDPVEVAAVLVDGMDLVVLGLGGRRVPPTRAGRWWRRPAARAAPCWSPAAIGRARRRGSRPGSVAMRSHRPSGENPPRGSGASAGCGCRSAGCARDGGWRPRRGRGEFRW